LHLFLIVAVKRVFNESVPQQIFMDAAGDTSVQTVRGELGATHGPLTAQINHEFLLLLHGKLFTS
jgi:hypothetical protein